MPKTPRLPMIATAATSTVLAEPLFARIVEHWREIAARIVVIIPAGSSAPDVKKIRFKSVNRTVPTLGDVVEEMIASMDVLVNVAAIADPFTALRWDVFKMFEIAENRHLSRSWMATAHPMRLIDFDTNTGVDETFLSFFCAPQSIWQFMFQRHLEEAAAVPFITPAWSGWLAHWSSQHVHGHKYHDITDLHAIGRYESAPVEQVGLNGIGKLTFNPPVRNYIKKIARL